MRSSILPVPLADEEFALHDVEEAALQGEVAAADGEPARHERLGADAGPGRKLDVFRRNPEPGLVDEEGLAVEDVEKPRDLEGLAQRVGKPGGKALLAGGVVHVPEGRHGDGELLRRGGVDVDVDLGPGRRRGGEQQSRHKKKNDAVFSHRAFKPSRICCWF